MTAIGRIKDAVLRLAWRAGVMERVRLSKWRRDRLLILCYHGVSLDDEHEWNPRLYMPPAFLRRRLELLTDGGYTILSLDEGVRRLREGNLPPAAICLTFDDGAYDFYARAYPVLCEFGVPATVYQTSYYADFARPVFDVMVSYLLWKGRRDGVSFDALVPGIGVRDLRDLAARGEVHHRILQYAAEAELTGEAKDHLLVALASMLGIDFEALRARRLLHIMQPDEIRELAERGVDFQLHTHRHRTPRERDAFDAEISENREWLARVTGRDPHHCCYPSGVYRNEMLPWLAAGDVHSATTCDPGIATPRSAPLLLPRFVDNSEVSEQVFMAWASGAADFLPRRTRFAHPEQHAV